MGISQALDDSEYGKGYESMLDDLLCVIHRDGGHYLCEHGLAKSYREGILKVLEAYHQLDKIDEANCPYGCGREYLIGKANPKGRKP